MPDVPAIGEVLNDYAVTSWFGLVGPARLPAEVVCRLDQKLLRLLADPAFKATRQAKGTDVVGQGSTEFIAYFRKTCGAGSVLLRLAGREWNDLQRDL